MKFNQHEEGDKMRISLIMDKIFVMTTLALTLIVVATYVDASASDISMESKGGVLYPVTGDSTQDIFRTPPHITDYLKPGMYLGVLPEDCISASHGKIGDYYICHHDLYLKPEVHGGRPAYLVIEKD
jgi:hypothetical protein